MLMASMPSRHKMVQPKPVPELEKALLYSDGPRQAVRKPGDGERAASLALPDVLLVIIMLRNHRDAVCYEVGAVEAHAKLPNHGDVCAGAQSLHERLQMSKLRMMLQFAAQQTVHSPTDSEAFSVGAVPGPMIAEMPASSQLTILARGEKC